MAVTSFAVRGGVGARSCLCDWQRGVGASGCRRDRGGRAGDGPRGYAVRGAAC